MSAIMYDDETRRAPTPPAPSDGIAVAVALVVGAFLLWALLT